MHVCVSGCSCPNGSPIIDDCKFVYIGQLCHPQSLQQRDAGINGANVRARCCRDNSCSAIYLGSSAAIITQPLSGVAIRPNCSKSVAIYRNEQCTKHGAAMCKACNAGYTINVGQTKCIGV